MYKNKLEISEIEKEKLFDELISYIKFLKNKNLQDVANKILECYKKDILCRSAGHDGVLNQRNVASHQCFNGGLIDHMLNVTKLAYQIGKLYEEEVDIDIVIFSAMFHDIGKVEILDEWNHNNNVRGNLNDKYLLVDHVYLGMKIVDEYLTKALFSEKYKLQILHIIGTHMDNFPKHMTESYIVSYADSIDADVVNCLTYERNKYNPLINRYIYESNFAEALKNND